MRQWTPYCCYTFSFRSTPPTKVRVSSTIGTLYTPVSFAIFNLHDTCTRAGANWVTNRFKIFRQGDFFFFSAALPLDWFGHLCGLSSEASQWLRLNKMLLYFSRISPRDIIYSKGESTKIRDLLIVMFLILHLCAAIFYYIGRAVPVIEAELGSPAISWLFIEVF